MGRRQVCVHDAPCIVKRIANDSTPFYKLTRTMCASVEEIARESAGAEGKGKNWNGLDKVKIKKVAEGIVRMHMLERPGRKKKHNAHSFAADERKSLFALELSSARALRWQHDLIKILARLGYEYPALETLRSKI